MIYFCTFLFRLSWLHSLIFVELEDRSLQVLDLITGECVGNYTFSSLFTGEYLLSNYTPLPLEPRLNSNIARTCTEKMSTNLKYDAKMQSILINNRGKICYTKDNIFIDSGISIYDIINEPKMHDGYIFLGSKENKILKIHGVNVFFVFYRLDVMSAKEGQRSITLNYIYFPFESRSENLILSPFSIEVKKTSQIRFFDSRIVNVYAVKSYEEDMYLSRIQSDIHLKAMWNDKERKYSYIWYVFLSLAVGIGTLYNLGRRIKIKKLLFQNDKYKIAEGIYKKQEVLIKIYKKNDIGCLNELEVLKRIHNPSISRYIYDEIYRFTHVMAIEKNIALENAIIKDKKKFINGIVKAVDFLHQMEYFYNNISPENIYIGDNEIPILYNFENCKEITGSLGSKNWQSADIIKYEHKITSISDEIRYSYDIFGIGLISYWIFYKEHLFGSDNKTDEGEDNDSDEQISRGYESLFTLIENNILGSKTSPKYISDMTLYSLIMNCTKLDYSLRYNMNQVIIHPFFWNNHEKFEFLSNLSDILEIREKESSQLQRRLERNKHKIFTETWTEKISNQIIEELKIKRIYNKTSVSGLLRAFRNKGRHYKQLPIEIKDIYNSFPDGYVEYYTNIFPGLLMVCYISATCISNDEFLSKFYP